MCPQIADISQYGDLAEVAELVVPKGATLVSSSVSQTIRPPRDTLVGIVEIPPKNYYIYVSGGAQGTSGYSFDDR